LAPRAVLIGDDPGLPVEAEWVAQDEDQTHADRLKSFLVKVRGSRSAKAERESRRGKLAESPGHLKQPGAVQKMPTIEQTAKGLKDAAGSEDASQTGP
jgi:hypothetical protein